MFAIKKKTHTHIGQGDVEDQTSNGLEDHHQHTDEWIMENRTWRLLIDDCNALSGDYRGMDKAGEQQKLVGF